MEYLEDSLAAAAANAFTEGAAATDPALTTPSRNFSIVQNFQKHFWVAGRQLAVRHAGMASMLSYQEMKNAKELKLDLELALHRGSAVSGNTNVAPNFLGFLNIPAPNSTNVSGATLTENLFNRLLERSFSFNANVREVYVNVWLKRTMNGFSTNVTRYIPAGEKRMVNPIEVYDSEFGPMALIKSRYQLQGANPTNALCSMIAIDPDYFQVGWLRPISTDELGKDGDRRRMMMVGEATLIRRSEAAANVVLDLAANIPLT